MLDNGKIIRKMEMHWQYFYSKSGEMYDGQWSNDAKHGVGKWHFRDGSYLEGATMAFCFAGN